MTKGDKVIIANPERCIHGCNRKMKSLKGTNTVITSIEPTSRAKPSYKIKGNNYNWCNYSLTLIKEDHQDQDAEQQPFILVVTSDNAEYLQILIAQKYSEGYVLSDKPVTTSLGFTVLMELAIPQKQL